ncbi:MAG: amidohydrolase [Acidobacteriota bacterium]
MEKRESADLILMNGIIFTSGDDVPLVQAVAIKDGKILDAGTDLEMSKYLSPETKKIDLKGNFACPGFNDSHIHFLGGGLYAKRLDLYDCMTPEEVAGRVKEKVSRSDRGKWILGKGWDHTRFPGKKWPSKELLDSVSPENPVFLRRVDGHIAWVNSCALKIAGISRETPDPEGGEIVRNEMGEPTGILKESSADLVFNLLPKPSRKEIREAIEHSLAEARRFGITSIQDNSEPEVLEAYRELESEGKLTLRVSEWLELKEDLSEFMTLKERFPRPGGLIRFFTLKGYVDGTLGSRTAAMIKPYSDDPSAKGLLQISPDRLESLVRNANEKGFQVALHAIGDLAVRIALNSFEALGEKGKEARNRAEHVQIIDEDDLPRFRSLGVIASMQPIHCVSDMRWAEERAGKERCRGAYAWKSILGSGANLAFGTDWPVESMNPMLGLHAAVTRMNSRGEPGGGWVPEQKITMEDAIRCYTAGSAYAEFAENEKGTIEKGKCADIVVLSKNLLEIAPPEILQTKVLYNIFNGKIVHDDIR